MEANGEFNLLPKKEVAKLVAERDKLELNLGGIKEMKQLPGLIFIVDTDKEHICVHEAKCLNIPTIGLVDTNCNPEDVTLCIPGNDDAIRAVKLIASAISDAVIEVKEGKPVVREEANETTEASEEVKEEVTEVTENN